MFITYPYSLFRNGFNLGRKKLQKRDYKKTTIKRRSATQDEYDSFIQELRLPKLFDEERDELKGPLRYNECKQVFKIFKNDKSTGEDGFTLELSNSFSNCLDITSLKASMKLMKLISSPSPKEEASLLLYQRKTAPC